MQIFLKGLLLGFSIAAPVGQATWWLTLSFLVGQVRGRLEAGWMVWVNRISGVVILCFGITALLIKTTG